MIICDKISPLRSEIRSMRTARTMGALAARVGLVPTMGFLHEGHASLIQKARAENEIVVVSIFINPLQFGPNEDLNRYPRSPEQDQALCEQLGVDLIFTPNIEEMYGTEKVFTRVHVELLGNYLCGASRPGHFDGVCMVVSKLFHIVEPDATYFGEKDVQQLRIVEQMVKDLSMPIEIVSCATVREEDGLAKSSRNAYLSPTQRKIAPEIFRTLQTIAARIHSGERNLMQLQSDAIHHLNHLPECKVDYLLFVDLQTLTPVDQLDANHSIRLAVAVYVGATRLIDNLLIT